MISQSFDERPVPFTNKSFNQLLDEKLSSPLDSTNGNPQCNKPKKAYLRKGEGLIKYIPKHTNCSGNVKSEHGNCSQYKEKGDMTGISTDHHQQRTVNKFLRKGTGLKRFRMKPRTGAKRKSIQKIKNYADIPRQHLVLLNVNSNSDDVSLCEDSASVLPILQQKEQKWSPLSLTGENSNKQTRKETEESFSSEIYEAKLQDESEELHKFEQLEQLVANSSFSSSCSFLSCIQQMHSHLGLSLHYQHFEENYTNPHNSSSEPASTVPYTATDCKNQCAEFCNFEEGDRQDIHMATGIPNFFQENMVHLGPDLERDGRGNNTLTAKNGSALPEVNEQHENVTEKCLAGEMCCDRLEKQITDNLKDLKLCNLDTDCCQIVKGQYVSTEAVVPNSHSEISWSTSLNQRGINMGLESNICNKPTYNATNIDLTQHSLSDGNVLVPDSGPTATTCEDQNQDQTDRKLHLPDQTQDFNILKSELLHKRLAELDIELSLYEEERLSLKSLRIEYESIIQKMLEEKEMFDNVIAEEKALIIREREEAKEQKVHLEQLKLQIMKEKEELESLKKLLKEEQCLEEQIEQIRSENMKNQYVITRLQRENQELKDEICKLKNEGNFKRKSHLPVSKLKAGVTKTKFINIEPKQMKWPEKENDNSSLVICDVVPKRCIPLAVSKDPPEPENKTSHKCRRDAQIDDHPKRAARFTNEKTMLSNYEAEACTDSKASLSMTDDYQKMLEVDRDDQVKSMDSKIQALTKEAESNGTQTEALIISPDLDIGHLDNRETIPNEVYNVYQNSNFDMISNDRITHVKTHPDGRKEIWYNNGCVCKISSDRMMEKVIYYNGDVLVKCHKNKTEKYYYCANKIWCTTYEDKTQLVEFSNGQTELTKPDGTKKTQYVNGATQTVLPDGRVEWLLSDGRKCMIHTNGEKTWHFPNGQKEIHAVDHKRRVYPDGTIKYVYPDGTTETKYASGRVRVKDKNGKLVMDSEFQ